MAVFNCISLMTEKNNKIQITVLDIDKFPFGYEESIRFMVPTIGCTDKILYFGLNVG